MTDAINMIRNLADDPVGKSIAARRSGPDICFPVEERPLFYRNPSEGEVPGQVVQSPEHKQLIRTDNMTPLAVVGNKYSVLENAELFGAVERSLIETMPDEALQNIEIIDSEAYGGAQCYREYRFRNMTAKVDERSNTCFRAILGNGFGKSAVTVIVGAIDFFCTNGMVLGTVDRVARKHSSGLNVRAICNYITGNVEMYYQSAETWTKWANKGITVSQADAFFAACVEEGKLSQRLAEKLRIQLQREAQSRGLTLWALYSALTYYATHPEDDMFAVRDTGNDTSAVVCSKREHEVRAITSFAAFKSLEAA